MVRSNGHHTGTKMLERVLVTRVFPPISPYVIDLLVPGAGLEPARPIKAEGF